MSTQDKYSLKRHLLQETTSNPNRKMLEELSSGTNDFSRISLKRFPDKTLQARFEWGEDPCLYMIQLTLSYDDVIWIDTIEAVHDMGDEYNDMCEGQGYASDMMYELMEFADSYDVQLTLVADAFNQLDDDDRRPDTAALEQWYRRLGFVDSPQGNGSMVYNFSS